MFFYSYSLFPCTTKATKSPIQNSTHFTPSLIFVHYAGAAQRVFLSSNNTSPCYNTTIDLICHYPTLMERVNGQYRYSVTTASWRANGSLLRIDGKKYSLRDINQTASRLTVSMKRAFFPGSPVSFTCYLLLTGGGEDSTTIIVYPQGVMVWQLYMHVLAYFFTVDVAYTVNII